MASSSSSSYSSTSSSTPFGCTHGLSVHNPALSGNSLLLGINEPNAQNNRYNKTISNSQLFQLLTSLANAAFPVLNNNTDDGVYFKHYNITTSDWVPSGGEYYYLIEHYFDNKYAQVTGYYKSSKEQFKFGRVFYINTRQIAVFVNNPINCKVVVQTDPGVEARGRRKFKDTCILELQAELEGRFILSSSSSSSSSSLSISSSSSQSSSSSSFSISSSSSSVSSSSSESSSSSSSSSSISSSSTSSSSSSDSFSQSSSSSSSSSSLSESSSSESSSSESISSSSSLSSSSVSSSSESSSSESSSSESSSSSSSKSSSSSSESVSSSSESSSSVSSSSQSSSSSCFMSPNDNFDEPLSGVEYPNVHRWYYDMNNNAPIVSGGKMTASVSSSANVSLVIQDGM
jgi:hypothetical protein